MNLGALAEVQLADITALVLVFQLDTRLSAETLTWLETCQPAGDVP